MPDQDDYHLRKMFLEEVFQESLMEFNPQRLPAPLPAPPFKSNLRLISFGYLLIVAHHVTHALEPGPITQLIDLALVDLAVVAFLT